MVVGWRCRNCTMYETVVDDRNFIALQVARAQRDADAREHGKKCSKGPGNIIKTDFEEAELPQEAS